MGNRDTLAKERLRASLALLPVDEAQIDYLFPFLRQAEPGDLLVIRKQVAPFRAKVVEPLWLRIKEKGIGPHQRVVLACLVAGCDPDNESWTEVAKEVVHQLVKENLLLVKAWMDALRPVRRFLLSDLAKVFGDRRRDFKERYVATSILAEYAADNPHLLAALIKDADFQQYAELIGRLRNYRQEALEKMKKKLAQSPPARGTEEKETDRLAKRRRTTAQTPIRRRARPTPWPRLPSSILPPVCS